MTLPQECGDVTGGVAVPQIGEEREKKARKSFFPGVSFRNEVCDGRRGQGLRSGVPWDSDCCLESPILGHVGAHLAPPEAA